LLFEFHRNVCSDCSFKITGFTYDGLGPDAYIWAAPGETSAQQKLGFKVDGVKLGVQDNATVTVSLPADKTWNDIPVLGVWCVQAAANFGHVVLAPAVPCKSTHASVGKDFSLATHEHMVSGTVTPISDCAFKFSGFNFDGAAPDTYWWWAKSESAADLKAGGKISPSRIATKQTNTNGVVYLPKGADFASTARVISVWCDVAKLNMGHTVIDAAGSTAAPAGATSSSAATPLSHSSALVAVALIATIFTLF
jgi:hypothetical protein